MERIRANNVKIVRRQPEAVSDGHREKKSRPCEIHRSRRQSIASILSALAIKAAAIVTERKWLMPVVFHLSVDIDGNGL